MTDFVTHSDGSLNDADLDNMLADLAFSPATDEIIGEVPLVPETEEVIETAPEVIEAAPVTLEAEITALVEAAPAPVRDTTLDDLDDLLAIDLVTPAEPAPMSDEESRVLDIEIAKADAYEAQAEDSTVTLTSDDEIEAAPAAVTTAKKAKAPKAPKAPAAPKVARDISTLEALHFATAEGTAADDDAKTALIAKRPKQVKIAEKFDNVIAALAVGRAPSVYVTTCFATLDARKEVAGTDLVAALQAADYTIGTARSQAGQIMELFAVLAIADRAGQKLTLRPDSAFAAKLRALPAA